MSARVIRAADRSSGSSLGASAAARASATASSRSARSLELSKRPTRVTARRRPSCRRSALPTGAAVIAARLSRMAVSRSVEVPKRTLRRRIKSARRVSRDGRAGWSGGVCDSTASIRPIASSIEATSPVMSKRSMSAIACASRKASLIMARVVGAAAASRSAPSASSMSSRLSVLLSRMTPRSPRAEIREGWSSGMHSMARRTARSASSRLPRSRKTR